MKAKQQGFTLIELIIVIVILGILAATALPKFTSLNDDAKEGVLNGGKGAILSAASICYANNKGLCKYDLITSATYVDLDTNISKTFTNCTGALGYKGATVSVTVEIPTYLCTNS